MDFKGVHKYEKCAEFTYDSKRYMVRVGVNPWNQDVLFSLYLDREPIIENRVCILGEGLLGDFGSYGYSDKIKGNFGFVPASITDKTGNRVDYKTLGRTVFLYFVTPGDSSEN